MQLFSSKRTQASVVLVADEARLLLVLASDYSAGSRVRQQIPLKIALLQCCLFSESAEANTYALSSSKRNEPTQHARQVADMIEVGVIPIRASYAEMLSVFFHHVVLPLQTSPKLG
jgi:hypothetical protein